MLLLLTATIFSQDTSGTDQLRAMSEEDSVFIMQKSPWGAVVRSVVIPGFGQLYNESYWKIPVVWGFLYYFGSVWKNQNDYYIEYQKLYKSSLLEFPGVGISEYQRLRNFYRNQRDEFAVYFFLTYFLQLVDAYVDSHLFDFDVTPNKISNLPQLNLRINLN